MGHEPAGAETTPASVSAAVRSVWALVGVCAVTVVLMAIFRNAVLGAWADQQATARAAFAQGGRAGLERAGITPPAFLPVAAVMFVVVLMLAWVLTAFLREGHRWAQVSLTAIAVLTLLSGFILGFRVDSPPVFVVLAVLAIVVDAALVFFLWHRDTRRFLSATWLDGPA
ncbi:MAG: hypothetical protein ACR2K3_14290 [Nocardioides sp.]